MYAMQRANGDWFALDDVGRLRVPVFRNGRAAMQARALNNGMMLFKPVVLDARALHSLAQTETEAAACFWLVDDPTIRLRRGRPLEFAQLALLIRDEEASSS
jgi:hypothetical protein